MCHIVCCTTKIRNSSAKVQQFFEKNNIPFVFMILYDKKRHPIWDVFFCFEPLAGLCRSGLFCSLTCRASRFAATNHRSSPKRHERLGDPLTVLVRDRW